MPLITVAFLAYAAGLIAGFAPDHRITVLVAAVSAGAAIHGLLARKGYVLAVATLLASGLVVALTEPSKPIHRFTPSVASPDAAPALERVRARAAERIERLFGDDAPMAKALLIAEQQDLGVEVRQRYADAGLVHMLSISGLHVAIVAGAASSSSTARAPRSSR